jgi:flagellar biosynthetic protein FliR
MSIQSLLDSIPTYVLVLFRVGGMMIFAPLFGSVRVPRAVKGMFAVVLAAGLAPGLTPQVRLPDSTWGLMAGIAGEMMFGLAMGMALSLTFIAVQWAGDIIGQQMGLNLAAAFDPSTGAQASVIADLYFMMTLVVFLSVNGHHAMLIGVRRSFDSLPLLSLGMDSSTWNLIVGLLHSCTTLAFQLAAPVLVTMLVVDVALGFIGKTVPQLNVMSVGISLRGLAAGVVVILGLVLTNRVISGAVLDSMATVTRAWSAPHP